MWWRERCNGGRRTAEVVGVGAAVVAGSRAAGVADAAVQLSLGEAVDGEPGAEEDALGEEARADEQLREHAVLAEDDDPDPRHEADGLREEAEYPRAEGDPPRR